VNEGGGKNTSVHGKVDCIINVCGKKHQTALALLSLLRYSGHHIDRIYFIEEQTSINDNSFIRAKLNDRIEHFVPSHWQWVNAVDLGRLHEEEYRLSIRYQYGWERTDKGFVFITHNDCIYHGDIVGALLENIGDSIAAGSIGQCWNCPASWDRKCDSDSYLDYRPSFEELTELYSTVEFPEGYTKRPYHIPSFHETFKVNPWPLPECRVNEWCALVNMTVARDVTMPRGAAVPLGAYLNGGSPILDVGVGWFRGISLMGHKCKNIPIYDYMEHTWGHSSMFDNELYVKNEQNALSVIKEEYANEYDLCIA
jgi:hypothetical protein